MARILNTQIYPLKRPVSLGDYVIGTDSETGTLKTKNFLMSDIVALANGAGLNDGVISGSVTWLQGLTYEVSPLEVIINGAYYAVSGAFVTLTDADPTDPRIDIITVKLNTLAEPPTASITVIDGDPSPNPVKPTIPNSEIEIEVTFAEIGAGETEPSGVTKALIYDENVGSPDEWDVVATILGGVSVILDSIEDPNTGTKSIKVIGTELTAGDKITYTSSLDYPLENISNLHFYINLGTSIPVIGEVIDETIIVRLQTNQGESNEVRLRDGMFGLDTTVIGAYQSIIIPITEFNFLSPVTYLTEIISCTFEFESYLADTFFIDTFNLVQGVNNPPIPNTYLNLEDTFDPSFSGKAGQRPSVSSNEQGLELTPSGLQDGVYSGGVIWLQDLDYLVSDLEVVINGIFYSVQGTTITLDTADPTNPRIDIITVKIDDIALTPIRFRKGDAATSPVKPIVPDSTVEIEITFIEIGAAATEPSGVSDDLIYDENDGSPSEWDVIENTSGARVTLDDATDPNTGTKHIKIEPNQLQAGDTITFTSDGVHLVSDISNLHFYIKTPPTIGRPTPINNSSITISLYDGATKISSEVRIIEGAYGFTAANSQSYQSINIPIEDFKFLVAGTAPQITAVVFELVGALYPEIRIDTFKLVAGVNNPPVATTWLGLSDTDDSYSGKKTYIPSVRDDELGLELIPQSDPTGLEAIDEGGGTGWRLIGRNPLNYGNLGQFAIDFSYSSGASSTRGATGVDSFAHGTNSIASGSGAVALGGGVEAIGGASFAGGGGTTGLNKAVGNYSFSFGQGVISHSLGEAVFGIYSTDYLGTVGSWAATDRIFNIGTGLSTSNRKDAFTVLKNGVITAPELTTTLINTESTGKVLITREALENHWRVKVSLTANEIKNLGTTPIEAIPAQGAGTVINVLSAFFKLNWNSVPYDNVAFTIESENVASVPFATLQGLANTSDILYVDSTGVVNIQALYENEAIELKGTDSVNGDGTIDVYITYEIITL